MNNEDKTNETEQATRREASELHDLLTAEAGVIISQFLLYMQQRSIWPCHLYIGDDAQQLTGEEVNKLKDDFKAMIEGS